MRLLFADAPPVRGALKIEPEDFVVEEIPAYLPEGEGDHLYFFIEKRGRTTQEVAEALAHHHHVAQREVGYAGQKDRQAITRQWFSVPRSPDALPPLETEGVTILESKPHRNKLRTGHLVGNRFWINLRGGGADVDAARTILEGLARGGVPNFYGAQRFGRDGENAQRGREVLDGSLRARRYHRKLYLSALQSQLFNAWLDARIDDGIFDTAIEGDLLQRRDGRSVFPVEDLPVEQARVKTGEVDPTGPIFGRKMRRPTGEAMAREQAILEAGGLTLDAFRAGGRQTLGTRRPARFGLQDLEFKALGADLHLAFTLPRGAYATVVLKQVVR